MDYMNTNVSLQLNRAAAKVENSSPDGRNSQAYERRVLHQEKEEKKEELTATQKLVSLSISMEGLQRVKHSEEIHEEKEPEFATEAEVEFMKKRMEGLSSQAVNGGFSVQDRIRFQTEIKFLSDEMIRINNGGLSFTKADNNEISRRIEELAKEMNTVSVHRRPASTFRMVTNQQKYAAAVNKLNIAI